MPTPDQTAAPVQEQVRFTVLYANVYADERTSELELGARVYRSPASADERRRTHPCRDGLVFVGVFPVSAAVPDSVAQAALDEARRRREQAVNNPEAPGETQPDANDEDSEQEPDDSNRY